MTPEWVHPGFVLIVGAWFVPLLKGVTKRAAMLLLPAAALVLCILMEPGTHGVVRFLKMPPQLTTARDVPDANGAVAFPGREERAAGRERDAERVVAQQ